MKLEQMLHNLYEYQRTISNLKRAKNNANIKIQIIDNWNIPIDVLNNDSMDRVKTVVGELIEEELKVLTQKEQELVEYILDKLEEPLK